MTSRECVRGCRSFEPGPDGKRVPQHYAACPDPDTCRGCVIRERADDALLCTGCVGRARRLVSDVPELLVRVRSKTLRLTSRNSGENQRTRPAHAPMVVEADPLDAILTLEAVNGADVSPLVADVEGVEWLSALVLDRHPEHDGVRDAWSVQDVMDRWGLEDKPDPHRHVYPTDDADDTEPEVAPVTEWFDPLIDVKQAAKRAGVTVRAVQKWVKEGRVTPVTRLRTGDGNVHTYFRASDIDNTTNHQNGSI